MEKIQQIYGIGDWFTLFFGLSESGDLTYKSKPDNEIRISKILQRLRVSPPVLLRFTGILSHMIEKIHVSFWKAIETINYRGGFQYVYPLKVCHDAAVVESILQHGKKWHTGLEAGSKSEFALALSTSIPTNAPIVYNGEKGDDDLEFVKLAQDQGYYIIVIADNLAQVKALARVADVLDWKPHIGIRLRLTCLGDGPYHNSSGIDSKFGISRDEFGEAVCVLKHAGLVDAVELVHFHLGSQVTALSNVEIAVKEAMGLYIWLRKNGAIRLTKLDCGGGLGSSGTTEEMNAVNYSVQEYATTLVSAVADACASLDFEMRQPQIIIESGRALVSHHALLVAEIHRIRPSLTGKAIAGPLQEAPPPATAFISLSIFRSLIDYFLEPKSFSVLPIQRLNEQPNIPVTIADLTLDSHGVLSRFPTNTQSTLLHEQTSERYFVAVPDVGAYQSVLGCDHNLYGDVCSVEIPEGPKLEDIPRFIVRRGPTVRMQIENKGYTWNPQLRTPYADSSTYPSKL